MWSFSIFLGLNVIKKTQIRLSWPPLLSQFLWSSLSLRWWPLFSLFSGALCIFFSRYSPFYFSLFLISFTFLLPYSAYFSVLSNSLSRFSRLFLCLSLLSLISRAVSFFHQNHFSTNLNYNNFLRLTKRQLCRYCCFASWLQIAKYWELLFNYNLTSMIHTYIHIYFI